MLMAINAHHVRSPLYCMRNLFDLTIRRAAQQPDLPLAVLPQAMESIDAMLALATRLLDAHAAEHQPLAQLVEDVRSPILAAAGRIGPLAEAADMAIALDLADWPLIAPFDAGARARGRRSSTICSATPSASARPAASQDRRGTRRGPRDDHDPRRGARHRPGLPRHVAQKIPSRQWRKQRRRGRHPRTGMGPFIVAKMAERMGATVRCDPDDGAGATFVVTLGGADDPGSS